jgi:hypothetical protein
MAEKPLGEERDSATGICSGDHWLNLGFCCAGAIPTRKEDRAITEDGGGFVGEKKACRGGAGSTCKWHRNRGVVRTGRR